eukprot:Platyproteum_vivax@DN6560_c0_g1_i2.p1
MDSGPTSFLSVFGSSRESSSGSSIRFEDQVAKVEVEADQPPIKHKRAVKVPLRGPSMTQSLPPSAFSHLSVQKQKQMRLFSVDGAPPPAGFEDCPVRDLLGCRIELADDDESPRSGRPPGCRTVGELGAIDKEQPVPRWRPKDTSAANNQPRIGKSMDTIPEEGN